MNDGLIEIKKETNEVYVGKLLRVLKDKVLLPDGCETFREYVKHPGAATVIPILPNNKIVMVRQFRYPIRQVLLELPAGKLTSNEVPFLTAQRELEEETGYRANFWQEIGFAYPCIGYSDEIIYYYVAKDLNLFNPSLDEGEFVEVVEYKIYEIFNLLNDNKITDSKTITGLMLARQKGFI